MSKEILTLIEVISNQSSVVELDQVVGVVEEALALVAEKSSDDAAHYQVSINSDSGAIETYRTWVVVDDDNYANLQRLQRLTELSGRPVPEDMSTRGKISLSEAQQGNPDIALGDELREAAEASEFDYFSSRIAAQQTKQAIIQRLRAAEREVIAADYRQRKHELMTGQVKRVTREGITLDMGRHVEALLPRSEMIPRENFRMGDRVRVVLVGVSEEKRGPLLEVSRAHKAMLVELFKLEVPEIGEEETINIMAAARIPGSRAKIAVKTNDRRIDPVGACVGMRGARVQAVSNELNGERVDIVLWEASPAQLVLKAMAPAEVSSIVLDEDKQVMDIAVREDQLALAIGRGGENIRLASELVGWTLNVMSEAQAQEKQQDDLKKLHLSFMEQLDVDEAIATVLVEEGFVRVDELAEAALEELSAIEAFDEDVAALLQKRAQDVLASGAVEGVRVPSEDLLSLEGMSAAMAKTLASNGVATRDELADQSSDELVDLLGIEREEAQALIMRARAHWFEED